jgi:hypothetical protein
MRDVTSLPGRPDTDDLGTDDLDTDGLDDTLAGAAAAAAGAIASANRSPKLGARLNAAAGAAFDWPA